MFSESLHRSRVVIEDLEQEGNEHVDYDDGNVFDVFGWWRASNITYNSRLVFNVTLK